MSKSLKKLIDINRLREFKNKLVGTGSPYVQTGAVDQTVAGTKAFSEPIVGSVTGSSGSCTGNAATATTATTAKACTGNAATATKLQTARTINGTAFNGTANITTANWGTARNISITDGTNTSTAVSVNGSANVSLKLPATIKANLTGNCSGSSGSCTGNAATATTATTAKSCTGNAATATKLATARSLWGNNFDGSAAITGAITGTPSIEFMPPATSNNGGYLDFHYKQSTADYTSRIIESASGTLSINNVTITTGRVVTAATFNGTLEGNVTGNAATATKATQDSDGNKITTTYSKNGHTHDDRYIPTSASCNKNWHWEGRGSQPSWLWGSEDGTNMYVYDPSNFRVNYAKSANSAVTADNGVDSQGGDWIRFRNGIQICWDEVSCGTSGSSRWTYGASFSSAPVVTVCDNGSDTNAVYLTRAGNIGTTSCLIVMLDENHGSHSNGIAQCIAIGRWK